MALVIGIDSSTQSTKAELRDADSGELVASGKALHQPTHPPVSEQDPASWWDALVDAVAQLGDRRKDAVAISVAGQQHGLVLLDDAGRVLRPAKLWNDTTSAANADHLVESRGSAWWAEQVGSVPVAAFTITKLAYVGEHEPDVVARVAKVMLPHDYLTWRLSGRHVTDRGDASGTGWFDASRSAYIGEALAAALEHTAVGSNIDWIGKLPTVLGPAEAAGTISPAAAGELGLCSSTIVGPGTGDNMAAALGLGLCAGDVVMSLGTSGTIYSKSLKRTVDPAGAVAGFADATGAFLPLVCTLNATKVTSTVAEWLGTDAAGLSALALDAGVEPSHTMLVPYFDGERTPNRPASKGIMVGLTNNTSRSELARAAHDGVLCGLLEGLDALERAGGTVDGRLILVGGGARSDAYRQRLADISQRTVHIPHSDETVATGAAIQAAAARSGLHADLLGTADDWNSGFRQMCEPNPDPATATASEQIRDRFARASQFDDGLCAAPNSGL